MATVIKNMKDLNKIVEKRAAYALKTTQKMIDHCIQESINEYYKEKVFLGGASAIPLIYDRTYKLLDSMVKTEIVKSGNTLSCQVGISEDYLNYKYPGSDSLYSLNATGRDVLTWNNENGSHGYTVDGDWKIWHEAMQTLGGKDGIISILMSKLKKSGLDIK